MHSLPHTPAGVAEPPAVLGAQQSATPVPPPDTASPRVPLSRLRALFPPGQFLRYLCVGVWNTVFGFGMYALFVGLLGHLLPSRWLPLNALLASVLSTPLNITMAFFGYKFVVFRTRGNYVAEWLRCFAVYGTSMIPGLLVLSALTRLFQTTLGNHLALVHQLPAPIQGKNLAAYLAGALLMAFTTVFSFVGHKTFSFRARKPAKSPTDA